MIRKTIYAVATVAAIGAAALIGGKGGGGMVMAAIITGIEFRDA